jgi:osmotically-inducible protein OsmY
MLPDTLWLSQPIDRPDEDVLRDVCDRLWQDMTTRATERRALLVEVHHGQVQLTGHVTTQRYRQHASDLVRGVRGVRAIHNALVADPDLVVAVAQALSNDRRTRAAIIRVGASHGWILLAGEVPDSETRLAAEEVSACVPAVRGVLGLPHLAQGAAFDTPHERAFQPRVGQAVFATDGRAGLVQQVVINPRSRLVSHIVVAGTPELNGRPVSGSWLVPIAAVTQANDGSVFLSDTVSTLVARRAYDSDDLILPPADWRLSFPYEANEVHWLVDRSETPAYDAVDEPILISDFERFSLPALVGA